MHAHVDIYVYIHTYILHTNIHAYMHANKQRHTYLGSGAITTVDKVLYKVDDVKIVVNRTVIIADGWVRTVDGWAVQVIFAGALRASCLNILISVPRFRRLFASRCGTCWHIHTY
jgi:hypothetical protein